MPSKRELVALSSDLGGYWDSKASSKHTKSNPTLSKPTKEPILKTKLGGYVDEYLFWVFAVAEEHYMCGYSGPEENKAHIIETIKTEGSTVVTPFFEPLNDNFMASLRYYGGEVSGFGAKAVNGLNNKQGSAVEQMQEFVKWIGINDDYYVEEETIDDLNWLIAALEEANDLTK